MGDSRALRQARRLRGHLKSFIDDINLEKEAVLARFVEQDAPQYRMLMRYKSDFIDQISLSATKFELDTALHRQLYEKEAILKREGARILAEAEVTEEPQDYFDRFRDFMERFNEVGKSSLAKYVLHRRVILDLLDKALSRDPSSARYALEKTVHRLIFPMRNTSDDVPFVQQNLWIIDERLTFHAFLASDQPLRSMSAVGADSDSRPDILIFDRPLAFTEGNLPLASMVVIEFKRPDRDAYREEDPVTQVYRMVREIRSGHLKDHKGREVRPLTDRIPAYCYIICDITKQLEIRLQDMSAFRTPDNLGYYGFNPNLNAYYEVISYQKLLGDARKRNRVLFERLNLPC